MALKMLMLSKRKKEKLAELEALRRKKAEFEQRESELEKALDEATTDEEINEVSAEVDKLDAEISEANTDEAIAATESEIGEIDAEIAAENEKVNRATGKPAAGEERKVTHSMNKRYIFGSLAPERRTALVERSENKEFLNQIREIMEGRGVQGAELTIPTDYLDTSRENVDKYSKYVQLVNLKKLPGKSKQNIISSPQEAIWTDAIANINERSLVFYQIEIDGYKLSGFIPVPNSLLEDSDENLAAEVLEMLTISISMGIDKAVVFGTGKRMPTGILTRLAQTAQPSNWEPEAPTWTDLHSTNIITKNIFGQTGTQFFASLATAFGVASGKRSWRKTKVCAMNEKTITDIKARALATNSAGLVMVGVNNIMPGFDGVIIEDNNLADYDILFGYFDVYSLVERAGASMKRFDQTLALKDQTLFIGGARYDGKPVFGEAFGIVNYNNTAPTTTATFAADEANVDLVKLSSLVLGAANSPITLHPAFDPNVLNYSATVTSHSTKVSATALKTDATVAIKIGDSTSVTNGSNATTEAGNNVLTIDVTNGNAAKRTYTVTISDETT